MTDRRLTPANGRVADSSLQGLVEAAVFVEGEAACLRVPVADLWRDTEATLRDRQLQFGEAVTVYERREGMAFLRAERDGYVGYVAEAALGDAVAATHIVAAPATHLYPAPDMKAVEALYLGFGARLSIVSGSAGGRFFETAEGLFVPRPHVRPANKPFTDPASVAQLFFGVPYLWGGNSVRGIDCSGLVQAALLACGIDCPGDSDLQEGSVGAPLPDSSELRRGDLLFWRGHVAIAVDDRVMIHANMHHAAVAYEPITEGTARIEAQGDGPVTTRRRVV